MAIQFHIIIAEVIFPFHSEGIITITCVVDAKKNNKDENKT